MSRVTQKSSLCLFFTVLTLLAPSYPSQLAGGWSPVEPTSQDVKDVALKALLIYPDSNTWNYPQHLVQVLEAESQVVAGTNHRLKVRVAVGACNRPYGASAFEHYDQDCYFEKVGTCSLEVHTKVWDGVFELTKASCGDFSSAWESVPLNDRIIEESTAVSLRRLENGTQYDADLYRVDQAFRNTVTPLVFKIYGRIVFHCAQGCPQTSESRALFTVRSDSIKHVMTRCEVDNKVVADYSVCTLIPAFPY